MLLDIKKQFTVSPQSTSVEAGRSVTFRCVPPPSAPPSTLQWRRNGVALEATDENLVLPRVSLQVSESIFMFMVVKQRCHYLIMVPQLRVILMPEQALNDTFFSDELNTVTLQLIYLCRYLISHLSSFCFWQ